MSRLNITQRQDRPNRFCLVCGVRIGYKTAGHTGEAQLAVGAHESCAGRGSMCVLPAIAGHVLCGAWQRVLCGKNSMIARTRTRTNIRTKTKTRTARATRTTRAAQTAQTRRTKRTQREITNNCKNGISKFKKNNGNNKYQSKTRRAITSLTKEQEQRQKQENTRSRTRTTNQTKIKQANTKSEFLVVSS